MPRWGICACEFWRGFEGTSRGATQFETPVAESDSDAYVLHVSFAYAALPGRIRWDPPRPGEVTKPRVFDTLLDLRSGTIGVAATTGRNVRSPDSSGDPHSHETGGRGLYWRGRRVLWGRRGAATATAVRSPPAVYGVFHCWGVPRQDGRNGPGTSTRTQPTLYSDPLRSNRLPYPSSLSSVAFLSLFHFTSFFLSRPPQSFRKLDWAASGLS